MLDYRNSPEWKAFLASRPKCPECGKLHVGMQAHHDHCSKFVHIVDDHYDSPCMLGTCKYCNPGYEPKLTVQVTEEEWQNS